MMTHLRMIFGITVCFLFLGVNPLTSQNTHVITGRVVNPYDGVPIEGALVSATGVAEPVSTDDEGYFAINVPALKGEVSAWASGFYTSIQSLFEQTEFHFVLIPEVKINYNEDLVLPFRRGFLRSKATNAINIGKLEFRDGNLTVDEALQNVFPGLQVINKSGMPGEGSYMSSRGIGSFVGNTSPLIVIDGVPYLPDMRGSPIINGFTGNIFKAISLSDISNISFLRGADAAIYGSLGANGVIMIETDDAADLDTQVEYIAQFGIASNVRQLPVLGVSDYKTHIGQISMTRYDDMADILEYFPYLRDNPDYYFNYLYNNQTDWQSEILRPAFVTENLVKIKGGDAIARYDLSFGYMDQQGVIDNTGFNRYHMRLNSNINVSQKVNLFATMSLAYMTNNLQEQGISVETNPLLSAMAKGPLFHPYQKDAANNIMPDYAVIRNVDGNILVNNAVTNPLALVNTSDIVAQGYDVLMNGGINYSFSDQWKMTGIVGLYHNYNREEVFFPGRTNQAIMPLVGGLAENTVRMGIGEAFNVYYNLNSAYYMNLGKRHHFNFVGGVQGVVSRREFDAGEGRNTSSDFYKTLGNVNISGRAFTGYIDKWNWMNFFLSSSYSYSNLLSAGLTASLDGSSVSGPDATRFGVFPAVNVAWHIKNMPFLSDSENVNRLNARAEYAVTGNSNFSSIYSEYYYRNQVFKEVSGIVRAGIPNTELRWEKNTTLNIGIDVSLFRHRLDMVLDFYNRNSSDVIINRQIPSQFGTNEMYDNLAEIRNRGIEAGLQYYILSEKDYDWVIGGNIAFNKNEIMSLGGQKDIIMEFLDGSALISKEGASAYSFYGYKTNGVYASSTEAKATGMVDYAGRPFRAGDIRFLDLKGNDNILDNSDRDIIGDPNPDFFGRFYTSVGIKRFRLTANFIYSYGNEAYNAVRREFESMKNFNNQLTSVIHSWNTEGQLTDMPRAEYGDPMGNNRFSDRWIEDASFIKLKELTLSYNLPAGILGFVRGGSVYLSGENLLTFTDYLGFDPEFAYSYSSVLQGYDYGKVPLPRTYKLGFRLQF